jgi:hypothetical protein
MTMNEILVAQSAGMSLYWLAASKANSAGAEFYQQMSRCRKLSAFHGKRHFRRAVFCVFLNIGCLIL